MIRYKGKVYQILGTMKSTAHDIVWIVYFIWPILPTKYSNASQGRGFGRNKPIALFDDEFPQGVEWLCPD